MLTRPLNAAVMNDSIGTYVILTLRGLVLSRKLQEQVSRGVETLPRTACYLMSGSLFSLRVVLNAESGALRSQNTPGGYGSLAFSGEAR